MLTHAQITPYWFLHHNRHKSLITSVNLCLGGEPTGELASVGCMRRADTRSAVATDGGSLDPACCVWVVWSVGRAGRMFVPISSQTLSLASSLYNASIPQSAWQADVLLEWVW